MQTVFFCFRFLCSWVEIFEWNKPQTISLIILILILFVIKCLHVFWRRSMDSLYCNQYTVYLFVYSCVWSKDSDGMSFQYRRLSGFLSFSGIFKMLVKKKTTDFSINVIILSKGEQTWFSAGEGYFSVSFTVRSITGCFFHSLFLHHIMKRSHVQ